MIFWVYAVDGRTITAITADGEVVKLWDPYEDDFVPIDVWYVGDVSSDGTIAWAEPILDPEEERLAVKFNNELYTSAWGGVDIFAERDEPEDDPGIYLVYRMN